MATRVHRDISPLLKKMRETLIGRKQKTPLRFSDTVAPRTQPPPILPEGFAHKLSANYYCNRDARRLVQPAEVIGDFTSRQPQITAGSTAETQGAAAASNLPAVKKPITPGLRHNY